MAEVIAFVGFGIGVAQALRFVNEKANHVRLAFKAHQKVQTRYCQLCARVDLLTTDCNRVDNCLTSNTAATSISELSTLKNLVLENIEEATTVLNQLASKIAQHPSPPDDESARQQVVHPPNNDEGVKKRQKLFNVRSTVQTTCNAFAKAFNINNVCEDLQKAENAVNKAIELTTQIQGLLGLQQLVHGQQQLLPGQQQLLHGQQQLLLNSDSILSRLPKGNQFTTEDTFSPYFDEPSLSSTLVFDFESREHPSGPRTSPEGRLLDAVLRSAGADGSRGASALGIRGMGGVGTHGMGGVGKTTALKRMCYHEEVRGKFIDGVCILEFGQDADDAKVMSELIRLVSLLGGKNTAKEMREMQRSGKLGDVVDRAAEWVEARTVLLVCDDLWATKSNALGYVYELKRVLRNAPSGRGRLQSTAGYCTSSHQSKYQSFNSWDVQSTLQSTLRLIKKRLLFHSSLMLYSASMAT